MHSECLPIIVISGELEQLAKVLFFVKHTLSITNAWVVTDLDNFYSDAACAVFTEGFVPLPLPVAPTTLEILFTLQDYYHDGCQIYFYGYELRFAKSLTRQATHCNTLYMICEEGDFLWSQLSGTEEA